MEMDPSQMILPKGFVVNSQDIYKEVASYPTVPPEKIKEYWKVYTTTFRRLIDPTANRLEHFWWHVWGSDRKNLPGAVLARLFEEISTGPTIAPIPGPPNRWEPPVFGDHPPPWELKRQSEKESAVGGSNAARTFVPEEASMATPSKSAKLDVVDTSVPAASSSSSKPTTPATPHPILKKSRGDSKSGPRPTARFIFPEDDDSKDEGEASSGSASTAGTDARKSSSPAKSDKKKAATPTKRFHASIASKRRPALPRRISSQSSATSETVTREDGGSRHQGGQRIVQPVVEYSGGQGSISSTASTTSQRSGLSTKAAGKRPALKQSAQEKASSRQETAQLTPTSPTLEATRKHKLKESILEEPRDNLSDTSNPVKLDRTKSTEFNQKTPRSRPPIPRSQSHIEPQRLGMGTGRTLRHALAAEPTASTTNVAALGTIIDFDGNEIPRPGPSTEPSSVPNGYRLPRGPSTTSLLDTRFMPTPPSATPDVPLGRTKSQLTLLLEREKDRLGDKPRSKH